MTTLSLTLSAFMEAAHQVWVVCGGDCLRFQGSVANYSSRPTAGTSLRATIPQLKLSYTRLGGPVSEVERWREDSTHAWFAMGARIFYGFGWLCSMFFFIFVDKWCRPVAVRREGARVV